MKDLESKLNIKLNFDCYCLHAPENYRELLPSVKIISSLKDFHDSVEWLHVFYTDSKILNQEISELKKFLSPSGQLWISWPKKSSKVNTDLSDMIVRQIGLDNGLVDTKIVAIDNVWSGLKFVFRLSERDH